MEGAPELVTHLTSGAMVVYLIEALKRWGAFRWLNVDTTTLNRALSAGAALLVSLGISITGDADTGWTIHVPMLSVLTAAAWEWAKQFIVQQVIYDGVVQKAGRSWEPVPGELVELVAQGDVPARGGHPGGGQ